MSVVLFVICVTIRLRGWIINFHLKLTLLNSSNKVLQMFGTVATQTTVAALHKLQIMKGDRGF